MRLSFLHPELARWDLLADDAVPEVLALSFFSDERPLRGAAGLCDWRLGGRLSRLLQSGRLRGDAGEVMLYPPGRKLPFPRLLLFGLGPQGQSFDEARAEKATRQLLDILGRLKLRRVALVVPGRSTGRLSARRAVEVALAAPPNENVSDIAIVESAAGQKEAADLVRGATKS